MNLSLFVLCIVPDGKRYLVVEERDGTFYLPAGRVEPGEDLLSACVRETAEEAGVAISVRGLVGIDHSAGRMRFCFVCSCAGAINEPKRVADQHSRGARWATLKEIRKLKLRHVEVLDWIAKLENTEGLLPASAYVAR